MLSGGRGVLPGLELDLGRHFLDVFVEDSGGCLGEALSDEGLWGSWLAWVNCELCLRGLIGWLNALDSQGLVELSELLQEQI